MRRLHTAHAHRGRYFSGHLFNYSICLAIDQAAIRPSIGPLTTWKRLGIAEPSSVPVPKTQNELRAGRKAENACKVPRAEATGDTYAMKIHKRKEKPPAFAIHNRRTNKHLGQLLACVVPTADVKVDQLVKELNSGSITEAETRRGRGKPLLHSDFGLKVLLLTFCIWQWHVSLSSRNLI